MGNNQSTKNSNFFSTTSTKFAFILGAVSGLAIFAVIAFIFTGTTLVKERRELGTLAGGVGVVTPKDEQKQEAQPPPSLPEGPEVINTIGTFSEVNKPICQDGKKPLVYMFSTSWCPHCTWAKPAFEAAVKDYVKAGKIVAYNWELDTNDNTLTSEKEKEVPTKDLQVYEEFNPSGSIPTFVFGCKYFRVGTGYQRENDLVREEKEFKDLIEKLLK